MKRNLLNELLNLFYPLFSQEWRTNRKTRFALIGISMAFMLLVLVQSTQAKITAQEVSICYNQQYTLTASGSGILGWYDASTGGNLLATGASYTTPFLLSSSTYYFQDSTVGLPATRIAYTVRVKPKPLVVIQSNSASVQTLSGNSYAFGNLSQNVHPSYLDSFLWVWGDNTFSRNTFPSTKTYTQAGNYAVLLVGYTNTGCADTASVSIQVMADTSGHSNCPAAASFSIVRNDSVQELSNNKFDFSNLSTHNGAGWINNYTWDFGDGTSDTINTFIFGKSYTQAGTYTVTLTATSSRGCSDIYTQTLRVTPSAYAAYTFTPNVCGSKYVEFQNTSLEDTSYFWDFGDNTYSSFENPNHTYAADGEYNVTLSINGGVSKHTKTVYVVSNPTAGTIQSSMSICGNVYTFTSTSVGYNLTYDWTFSGGTGAVSTARNALRAFASSGIQNVDLVVTADGRCSTTVATYTLNAQAATSASINAYFTHTMVQDGNCHTGVLFTNTTPGVSNVVWNFGDGTASVSTTEPSIFHAYAATGTFVVSLTATRNDGCSGTNTANVTVSATGFPRPLSMFSTDMATQCITGNRFDFFNRTQYTGYGWVPHYYWDFGDGTQNNANTHIYGKTYASPGFYQVRLVAESNYGCKDTSTSIVTVLWPNSCSPGMVRGALNGTYQSEGAVDEFNKASSATGLGSKQDISNEISLFPNPNQGSFTLGIKGMNSKTIEVQIMDMLGRIVYENNYDLNGSQQIELQHLNLCAGTYNVLLKGELDQSGRKSFVVLE